ncbi:MAG TPA: diguanylate cyclase [Mycobacteriales bacterium]
MPELLERRHQSVDNAVTAVIVLGIEALQGSLTISDFQVAVQRLERAIRPWDSVVNLAPRTVGVLCTSLSNAREADAIAARLADVVRAPMAVGDAVRQVGVCVGSSVVEAGEEPGDAFGRAREAMRRMRAARRSLVVPPPR